MKILQISKYYYPYIGGIEQVARECSRALTDYEQKIFCFNHEKKDDKNVVDGIEIIRAGCFAKVASQSLSFSYGRLLQKTFEDFQPDVVIFHYPNPFSAHYLLKILKKYPKCRLIIYWHLDIVKQKLLGKFFYGQNNKLLKKAEKIIATSPNYIEGSKFLSAYREKCVVIPCCVNASRMTVTEAELSNAKKIKEQNSDKTICFSIGRHVPYKGMEYLIRASKLLDNNFKIFIAGEGPLTDSLKALASDDEKISFLGKVNEADLKAYLLACDIFCFPSITKNEAFGIALAEGLYFGKPAVTFTIHGSGVNYVSIDKETGIEVENKNIEKYAEAIKLLADDASLRKQYGDAARSRVNQLFTEELFMNNIKNLIASLSEH